ncbi:phytochelatin synthase family protein [Lysobacter arvi]|uniref:glutathione gamma-glutamylcysteinyltransferase n=1 Tax=Lysobacter arvi TaxID=3038776 RepID=A0ABU1CHS6_9GAMM|nr:phytochelatin synthase family protein [Lysobacter arvi]MDR0184497.1 phytochelatin synthase family protein [Lysobacter arvi]
MKRILATLAATAVLAFAVGAGAAWNKYLRAPTVQMQPMPAHLIALDSGAGQKLLARAEATADFDALMTHFVPQTRRAFCGVASALTTLNAARTTPAPLDQSRLFDHPKVSAHPLKVSVIGMSLDDFATLLRAHGARVSVVYASASSLDAFRKAVRENLATPGDFLLVNYQRSELGQAPMGHISPIAAYDETSDRLLVLDVAAHKYPPTWVETRAMWKAMRAPLNPETNVTRGYLVMHGDGVGPDALTARATLASAD